MPSPPPRDIIKAKGGIVLKSDKELAVELMIAYLEHWNVKHRNAIQPDDFIDVFKAIYKTIIEFPRSSDSHDS